LGIQVTHELLLQCGQVKWLRPYWALVKKHYAYGAAPLSLGLNFSALTQYAQTDSATGSANGNPPGEPTGININQNGEITVTYSNQQTPVVGQVAVATFVNEQGCSLTIKACTRRRRPPALPPSWRPVEAMPARFSPALWKAQM
jgi:hypothetical protein